MVVYYFIKGRRFYLLYFVYTSHYNDEQTASRSVQGSFVRMDPGISKNNFELLPSKRTSNKAAFFEENFEFLPSKKTSNKAAFFEKNF